MNEAQLIKMLKDMADAEGATALAKRIGVSKQYLGAIIAGHRTPGPSVLRGLGLARVVRYEISETA